MRSWPGTGSGGNGGPFAFVGAHQAVGPGKMQRTDREHVAPAVRHQRFDAPDHGRVPAEQDRVDREARPDGVLRAHLGQLFEQKNYAAALEGYSAIMAKYPDAYIIWQNVGNAHFAQEQYDKAEEAYRKVLAKTPDDPHAIVAVGNCYMNRNQTEQALEWYGKVDFAKIDDPTVLYNIGLNFFNLSKFDEALKYFQRSVEIQKSFEDGYYQMGLAFVSMQKKDEAIAVYEQFLKDFPESAKVDQVKGFLEYLKKK